MANPLAMLDPHIDEHRHMGFSRLDEVLDLMDEERQWHMHNMGSPNDRRYGKPTVLVGEAEV